MTCSPPCAPMAGYRCGSASSSRAKAFARTAAYDAAIARWFGAAAETMPERLVVSATRPAPALRREPAPAGSLLRHRPAAGHRRGRAGPGQELSYNNLADADAALELVSAFSEPAVAIIKHANPCGVAIGQSLEQAYPKALACDPVSAYGGIVRSTAPWTRRPPSRSPGCSPRW